MNCICDNCMNFPCGDETNMIIDCCEYEPKPKVQTNADRIRAMTDEELTEWVILMVCKYRSCGNCPMSDWCSPSRGIADWLKSPTEVDE